LTARGGSRLPRQLAFLLCAHLQFVVLAAGVLLLALTVARYVHPQLGFAVVVLAALALIVGYQRVAAVPAWLVLRLFRGGQAQGKLPESYAAALSICHLVPMLLLFDVVDGSVWLHQHAVADLPTPDALPLDQLEGVYRIEDAVAVTSMRFRHYGAPTPKSTQQAKYSQRDSRTAWDVMPLVSGKASVQQLDAIVQSGQQCIWLGSRDSGWIVDRLPASDDSEYFVERESRDVGKYLDTLRRELGQPALPACTRVLERMPSPDIVQRTYRQWSLLALSVAHGIPAVLLVVFYWFSDNRRREHRVR
jgi:hypothetical protein